MAKPAGDMNTIRRRRARSGNVSYSDSVVLHETSKRRIVLVPYFIKHDSGQTELAAKLVTYLKTPSGLTTSEEKSITLQEPAARLLLKHLSDHLAVAGESEDGNYILLRIAEGTASFGDHDPAVIAATLTRALGQSEIVRHLQQTELSSQLVSALKSAIRLNEMRAAAAQLRNMLDTGIADEADYQRWCDEHSWAFGNAYVLKDNIREITPGDHIDIMLSTIVAGYRDIVELKRPDMDGTNLRTNLYVIGMAGSGGGKDHARGAIKEAFIAAGLQRYLGGNRLASGSGLLTALYRQPSSLFQIDEFGQFLGNIVNKRHAPKYLAEIWDLLTELYTSAGGTFFGAEYADQKQRPRQDIAQPCCCVHATTVPEPFWAALQEGSMVDGSLARFLVFQTDDDVPDRNRRPKPVSDVPANLIDALQAIAAGVSGHGRGNVSALVEGPMIVPDPYSVPMAPDAEQLFDTLDEELTARQREAIGTDRSAVLARVWENTAKVALIKAVSANPQTPVVRVEDAEWARLLVDRCVTTMITEAERHIAENRTQANHQKVLRLIQGAGERGLSRNEITRRTQFLERKQREDILSALVEAGQIELGIETTAGRQAAIYRAAEQ